MHFEGQNETCVKSWYSKLFLGYKKLFMEFFIYFFTMGKILFEMMVPLVETNMVFLWDCQILLKFHDLQ
jgi:hypothetical protein